MCVTQLKLFTRSIQFLSLPPVHLSSTPSRYKTCTCPSRFQHSVSTLLSSPCLVDSPTSSAARSVAFVTSSTSSLPINIFQSVEKKGFERHSRSPREASCDGMLVLEMISLMEQLAHGHGCRIPQRCRSILRPPKRRAPSMKDSTLVNCIHPSLRRGHAGTPADGGADTFLDMRR
jgi:hypothetical protein